MIGLAAALVMVSQSNVVTVKTTDELQRAVLAAMPGTEISVAPGEYRGGLHFKNIHGKPGKPIIITQEPKGKAVFKGGGSGLQLSNVSHLQIDGLSFEGASGNGLNIDDGGNYSTPSHHLEILNITVSDLPKGNHDGIKLSGVTDFRIINANISRWGGSGIDMVGCHRGMIFGSTFVDGGDSGIQAKGGTSQIQIVKSKFLRSGHRGVNIGGSTGREFFRPPLSKVPEGKRFEAQNIAVEGCSFQETMCAVSFVGVDGAKVRNNDIYRPGRWAFRILQETNSADFIPCRNGVFQDNIIAFQSGNWGSGGVNIGPGTKPETFKFSGNVWYCEDRPQDSKPSLPTPEAGGIYGSNPMFQATKDSIVLHPSNPKFQDIGAFGYRGKP